ncbi:uncharacterized protein DUF3631 [Bifidobacterium psychraerophilum DSM 22366]|uniref:Putative phiRv2 prophage protein n=3 Tax=Bifidobacterium psychraerophilum TaxID=218140 RepID=A0A087CGH9_9BIFI|nr:DUF3631 domain-containing protein [Bifidobacterium psychraerophilum]KFI82379.1 putative phiRv2 prophage protein [Bifidobacterium psychraerophilum]PKA95180.1 uncharacterized protein DUF3631 [Bifidobacterium psychraerophilum DSM 22366]
MSAIDDYVQHDSRLKARFEQVGHDLTTQRRPPGKPTAKPHAGPHENEVVNPANAAEVVADVQTATTAKETATNPIALSKQVSIVSEASNPSTVGNQIVGVLQRYIGSVLDDLMMLTLWILHTLAFKLLNTTPRLLITSILPASGKSTLLDWLFHLCYKPILMASISSAAMLSRAAADGGTLLIDEADRTLRKDNPYTADLLAISNSGYKEGGSRPTLMPAKGGGWDREDLPTWCPVAYAGNNPDLPDDTFSRCITVFLYPSDSVSDTDWELIRQGDPDADPPIVPDTDYLNLSNAMAEWEKSYSPMLKHRPQLDPSIKGRAREKWLPLARVAQTLADYIDSDGNSISWLDTVRRLALADVEQVKDDAALGLRNNSPHTAIVTDIARLWSMQWSDQLFIGSQQLCSALANSDPEAWGAASKFGTQITPRRLAGMLKKVGVNATRNKDQSERGYYYLAFREAWHTLHVWESLAKENITQPPIDGLDASDTIDTLKERAPQDGQLDF